MTNEERESQEKELSTLTESIANDQGVSFDPKVQSAVDKIKKQTASDDKGFLDYYFTATEYLDCIQQDKVWDMVKHLDTTDKTYTSVASFSLKGVGEFYTYKNSATGRDYTTRKPPMAVAAIVKAVKNGTADNNQDAFAHNMAHYLS